MTNKYLKLSLVIYYFFCGFYELNKTFRKEAKLFNYKDLNMSKKITDAYHRYVY